MQIDMDEAKSQLSRLGKLAWEGEDIVIFRAGKPYLRLVPYPTDDSAGRLKPRPIGLHKGQIWVAPDFEQTPQEIVEAFKDIWPGDSS